MTLLTKLDKIKLNCSTFFVLTSLCTSTVTSTVNFLKSGCLCYQLLFSPLLFHASVYGGLTAHIQRPHKIGAMMIQIYDFSRLTKYCLWILTLKPLCFGFLYKFEKSESYGLLILTYF